MKSLIWKELHENIKWAVLLLLVFGGVGDNDVYRVALRNAFLSFVVFIAAVSGAAWGLWQTAFDAQGDRRAHLLHRPLSPSWIFVGKLLTGAGLYLVAMSLPLAVYGMWTAMPGHMPAPFRWQALLPWLADILTGLVYYSAGTLMGVRPGRWYGSRCLGIPAALLCTFLVWNVPEFWHALVAIVAIGGLIAVAAWGSFLSGGSLDQQPRAAKAALACTYLMGLIVVSVEAKVIAESLIVPADAHRRSQYYAWDREGRLMVVHQLGKDGYRLTDIAGREFEEFQRNPISSSAELALLYAPSTYWGSSSSPTYRTSGWRCVPFLGSSLVREENWYYLPDDGRLVGYDRANNRFLGSFGPDGFSPPGERPASRFTGELSIEIRVRSVAPLRLLAFPHEVYAVDLRGRSMKRLFVAPSGETVLWAQPLPEERQTPMQVVVGTDRSIHVVDDGGRELVAAPWAYDRARLRRDYCKAIRKSSALGLELPSVISSWHDTATDAARSPAAIRQRGQGDRSYYPSRDPFSAAVEVSTRIRFSDLAGRGCHSSGGRKRHFFWSAFGRGRSVVPVLK